MKKIMKVLHSTATVIIVVLLNPVLTTAQTLKDPRTRDEDLSATIVTVQSQMLPSGMYEYIYDIESPLSNKGRILTFHIDISCSIDFGPFTFPDPPDPYYRGDFSSNGLHLPVQAHGVPGLAESPLISHKNSVSWALGMDPGLVVRGIRLISPAPPGIVSYELTPSMDTEGWDYGINAEDDPAIPWIPDFTVIGTTTGPACTLTPPTDTDPTRYAGTDKENKESEAVNNLLTYSAPLQNQLHVPAGSTEYALTIHYGQDIDAGSFKVKPKKIQSLFHPQPGTFETVQIPLRKKKTIIKFEVRSGTDLPHDDNDDDAEKKDHKSESDHDSQDNDDKKHKKDKDDKDNDRFEIRVDQAE